jgi:hypothetical protein
MPFPAARAIAATFCYNIRHALTPVFGNDFIHACVPPDDPIFGRMVIDESIVRHCTAAAEEQLLLASRGDTTEVLDRDRSGGTTPIHGAEPESWSGKSRLRTLRPKLKGKSKALEEVESGYGTDTSASEGTFSAPTTPSRKVQQRRTWAGAGWTAVPGYGEGGEKNCIATLPMAGWDGERGIAREPLVSGGGRKLERDLALMEGKTFAGKVGNSGEASSSRPSLPLPLAAAKWPKDQGPGTRGCPDEMKAAGLLLRLNVDDAALSRFSPTF